MASSTQPPNASSSRLIACDFCGEVTRIVWLSDGRGECGACHRVMIEAEPDDDTSGP